MATSPRGLHYSFSMYLYAQQIRAFLSNICTYFSALRCIPQSCAIVGKNVMWNFFQQNGNLVIKYLLGLISFSCLRTSKSQSFPAIYTFITHHIKIFISSKEEPAGIVVLIVR